MLSRSTSSILLSGAVALLAMGALRLATAATPSALGELATNEGIFVNPSNFNILKGVAKGDPSAHITKMGAREVSSGAIIFRAGDKLYLVDANPEGKSLFTSWDDYYRFGM